MVVDGKPAPQFKLLLDDGQLLELGKLEGKPLVLYFYPKDDTSGCTAEAKDFSCLADQFASAGADVVGVSPDSAASHQKFRRKHALTVRLATDESKVAAEAFGVWVEKSMYGRTHMGVERATFLIDGQGVVAKSWRKVKVPGHAAEVLRALHVLKR